MFLYMHLSFPGSGASKAINDLAGNKNPLASFQIFVLVVVGAGFVTAVFLICSVYKVVQIKIPSVVLLFPLYLADILNLMRLNASMKPSAGSL